MRISFCGDLGHSLIRIRSVEVGWQLPQRRYVEAFARLSISPAFREIRLGHAGAAVWRNRFHHEVGTAWVASAHTGHLHIDYNLADLSCQEAAHGAVDVNVKYKGSAPYNVRPYAECPECLRDIMIIILKDGRWGCHRCHNLLNRSAIVSKNVRLSEKRDQLCAKVELGRPKHMRQQRYADALDEIAKIDAEIGKPRLAAASDHLDVIETEWIKSTPPHTRFRQRLSG